jgi:GAF domain-containing protein
VSDDRRHETLLVEAHSDEKLDVFEENRISFRENDVGGKLYAEYRRLAAEQAALHRLAGMVSRGVEPRDVFAAVADEMRQCLTAETAELWRFETDCEITMLADSADPSALAKPRVGTQTSVEGNIIATLIRQIGEPARLGSYDNGPGLTATRMWGGDASVAVSAPIIIDERPWGLAIVGFERGRMPADAEIRISHFAEQAASAIVACHRDEQKRLLLSEASQASTAIGMLLDGRALDDWSLREVAGRLRLPACGRFVVIAAQALTTGDAPLPEIEPKLRSLDISSAWQLLPDVHVGIVHVRSEHKLRVVIDLISRTATDRVGVSAMFEDLRDTPKALHVARVMAHGSIDSASGVNVFDGSILATAAISAPEVMIKKVGASLDCFSDLSDYERDTLFETFRVWQDGDASANSAAQILVCHPNTVRHRLRRIEERTGRSLSRPRDVAELCLAFEVHRHLM